MKILVSNFGFTDSIRKIDLDNVRSVSIDDNKYFTINYGRNYSLVIPVESSGKSEIVVQDNVRWDFLYRDLKGIQEQPVVIEFLDNVARFTLKY